MEFPSPAKFANSPVVLLVTVAFLTVFKLKFSGQKLLFTNWTQAFLQFDCVVVEPALYHLADTAVPAQLFRCLILDVLDAVIGQVAPQEPGTLGIAAMVWRVGLPRATGVRHRPAIGIVHALT